MQRKRDILLILFHVLVGPLVGGAIGVSALLLEAMFLNRPIFLDKLVETLPTLIVLSYTLGLVPALVTGLINCVVARKAPSPAVRLLLAALIGALCSVAFLAWIIGGITREIFIFSAIALGGALAAVLSTLLAERFSPIAEAR